MTAAASPSARDPLEALFPAGVVAVSASGSSEAADPADPDVLDAAERAQIGHAGAKRQREYATGRRCAREALARLGIHDFPLLSDDQRAPLWPDGIVGSITHCPGYCGVVVAPKAVALGLGLDAEASAPLSPGVARRICTPAEAQRLSSLPESPGVDWAKLSFSAKESFYKCYFPLTRMTLGFRDVEIDFEPAAQRFVARVVREGAPAAAGLRSLRGRFRVDRDHVFTGVTLPARDPALDREAP